METWIGFAGAIIGALLAMLGVFISNRINKENVLFQVRSENINAFERVRTERLEELYILLSHVKGVMATRAILMLAVLAGKLTYEIYLDQVVNGENKQNVDFHRTEMIVMMYWDELKDNYFGIRTANNELNDVYENIRRDPTNKIGAVAQAKSLMLAQKNFDAAIDRLMNEIHTIPLTTYTNSLQARQG